MKRRIGAVHNPKKDTSRNRQVKNDGKTAVDSMMNQKNLAIVALTVFTVCGFMFLGCGESIEEENDADLLEPAWDFQLRELDIDHGSLIRPEDVPVVTIEITRRDDENVWWRLTANPAPTHEDLVVGVRVRYEDKTYVIPKKQNNSMEYRALREEGSWRWESAFAPSGVDSNGVRKYMIDGTDINIEIWVETEAGEYKPIQEVAEVWAMIDGKLERHEGAEPPPGEWRWVWPREGYERYMYFWEWKSYNRVIVLQTTLYMLEELREDLYDPRAHDLPPFLTDDGYAVPHGFKFTYYRTAGPSEIVVPGQKGTEKPNTPP